MRWCTKIDKYQVYLSLFVSLELSLSSSIFLCRRPFGFWSRPWPVASGDNLLHGCPDPPEALVMARLPCPDHHHLQWSSPHYCHQVRHLLCQYLPHLQNRKVNLWLGKMTQGQSSLPSCVAWFDSLHVDIACQDCRLATVNHKDHNPPNVVEGWRSQS